jgi:hypothetical protein
MEATYKTKTGQLMFKITGETPKAIFHELAKIQEIFDSEFACGVCESTDIQYRMRTDKEKNDYYELHCQNNNCRARLSFGQHKVGGTLFVKRKDSEGNWIPNGGWERYDKNAK